MKKILVVAHCILNRASKVERYSIESIDKENDLRKVLLYKVFENDIELLQLPCPEFTMYGSKRWGHVKDQFDNTFFRNHCKNILQPVIEQIIEYYTNKEKFEILGIVAVDGSPSCGYNFTCKGNYGGELGGFKTLNKKIESIVLENESGVFMEELKKLLGENNLNIPIRTLKDEITYLENYNIFK